MGHQHEDKVIHDETGAHPTRFLSAPGQLADCTYGLLLIGGEIRSLWKGGQEGVGEPPAARVEFTDSLDQNLEAVPGVRVRESVAYRAVAGPPLLGEGRRDQSLLGREVPIERGWADLRVAGYAPHGRAKALLAEHGTGGIEDAGPGCPGHPNAWTEAIGRASSLTSLRRTGHVATV